jgi:hypothetical protein
MPVVTAGILMAVLVMPGTAGAAVRQVDGGMSGPGGFRQLGCAGTVSAIGNGTFAATGLGIGTYTFEVCISNVGSRFTFSGTARFTTRNNAELRGTISGQSGGGFPPFTFTVTSGTRRFKHAVGMLVLGPFTESNQTNCAHQICSDWTDSGPIKGTLRHVAHA